MAGGFILAGLTAISQKKAHTARKRQRRQNEYQARIIAEEFEAGKKALAAKEIKDKRDAETARIKRLRQIKEGKRKSTNILTSALGLLDSQPSKKNPTTTLLQ